MDITFVRLEWQHVAFEDVERFAVHEMTSTLSRVLCTENVILFTTDHSKPTTLRRYVVKQMHTLGIDVELKNIFVRGLTPEQFMDQVAFLWARKRSHHGFVEEDLELLTKPRSLFREIKRRRSVPEETDVPHEPMCTRSSSAAAGTPKKHDDLVVDDHMGKHPVEDMIGDDPPTNDARFERFLEILQEARANFVTFEQFLLKSKITTDRLQSTRTAITKLDDVLRRLDMHMANTEMWALWARGHELTRSFLRFPGRPQVEHWDVCVWGHYVRVWYTGSHFSVTASVPDGERPDLVDTPEFNGVFARMLFYFVGQKILDEAEIDFEGCLFEALEKLEEPLRHPLFFDDAAWILDNDLPRLGDVLNDVLDMSPAPLPLLENLGLQRHQCPVMFLRHHMLSVCESMFF